MAGLIPQSFIDDLLSRADIIDVIDSRVTLKKTGKNYSGLCPFHQEKSPSFSVEPDKQFYYCFGCGAYGNAIGFVMNYENLDFPQSVELLANSLGLEVPREESEQAKQNREKNQGLHDILQQAASFFQSQLRRHPQRSRAVDYLKVRGLSGEIARDFCLGYAPPGWSNLLGIFPAQSSQELLFNSGMTIKNADNKKYPVYDRFRDRIMFPIRDRRGRVIAFGGRVLGDDKPKYLNSPETPVFRKGEELYGLFEARQKVKKLERVIIVEGYMDVIALAQNGIHYSVATLGTATSINHLTHLFKLVPEVIFCFDGDKAGRKAAWRALEQVFPLMEDGRSARFLFLPDGEDPDSQVRKVGQQSFENSILSATQLTDFFFEKLTSQVDMNTLEGRARLGKESMPYIKQLPSGFFCQLMLDQLAQVTGVNQQTLRSFGNWEEPQPQTYPDIPANFQPPQETEFFSSQPLPLKPNNSGRSVCMQAVNLILLQPSIVSEVELSDELEEVKSNDIALLLKVIDLAKTHPSSSTPELLGRIYATPLGTQLIQLFDREQITPKDGVIKEFKDSIQRLLDNYRHKKNQNSLVEQARQKLQKKRQNQEHDSKTDS